MNVCRESRCDHSVANCGQRHEWRKNRDAGWWWQHKERKNDLFVFERVMSADRSSHIHTHLQPPVNANRRITLTHCEISRKSLSYLLLVQVLTCFLQVLVLTYLLYGWKVRSRSLGSFACLLGRCKSCLEALQETSCVLEGSTRWRWCASTEQETRCIMVLMWCGWEITILETEKESESETRNLCWRESV